MRANGFARPVGGRHPGPRKPRRWRVARERGLGARQGGGSSHTAESMTWDVRGLAGLGSRGLTRPGRMSASSVSEAWSGTAGGTTPNRTTTRGRGAGNGQPGVAAEAPHRWTRLGEARGWGGEAAIGRVQTRKLDERAICGCPLTTRRLQREARGIFSAWSQTPFAGPGEARSRERGQAHPLDEAGWLAFLKRVLEP